MNDYGLFKVQVFGWIARVEKARAHFCFGEQPEGDLTGLEAGADRCVAG